MKTLNIEKLNSLNINMNSEYPIEGVQLTFKTIQSLFVNSGSDIDYYETADKMYSDICELIESNGKKNTYKRKNNTGEYNDINAKTYFCKMYNKWINHTELEYENAARKNLGM